MNGTLSKLIIFAAGAIAGSVAAGLVVKARYEKIMHEEAESIRDSLSKLYNNKSEPRKSKNVGEKLVEGLKAGMEDEDNKLDLKEYADKIQKQGYNKYSDKNTKKDTEVSDVEKPYVITSEEFGELYDYETITLNFYADGVLTDDHDDIIDEPEDIVGTDYMDSFGEDAGDPDVVYVRNDSMRCDYEILLNSEPYSGIDE